jgi:hypothetical protein
MALGKSGINLQQNVAGGHTIVAEQTQKLQNKYATTNVIKLVVAYLQPITLSCMRC